MARISAAKMDGPRHVRVSVGFQPAVTLLSLVADGLGAKAQGVPDRWRRAVRQAVGESAGELRPVFAPHGLWIPDCLCPDPLDDGAIGPQLDRMAQTTAEDLYEEVVANFPGGLSPRWQHVIDDPRGFVAAYIRTLARVWAEFEPVWKQSRDLLHREAERIGAASVTGTLDAALATLNHPISLADESLRLPGTQNSTVPLHGRPITLIPIVSGSAASIYNVEAESVWVGYPVPGVGRLWESGVASAPRSGACSGGRPRHGQGPAPASSRTPSHHGRSQHHPGLRTQRRHPPLQTPRSSPAHHPNPDREERSCATDTHRRPAHQPPGHPLRPPGRALWPARGAQYFDRRPPSARRPGRGSLGLRYA